MQYNVNNKDDLTKLNNAISYKQDEVSIIDPTAETEDELKDSYVGKYIAKCTVCEQLVYLNTKNIREEIQKCPYCVFENCFVLVGVVNAISGAEEAKKNEDKTRDLVYGSALEDKTK